MTFKLPFAPSRLLLAVIAIVITATFFVPAIPQNPAYHQFADQRTLLNVPHLWNVISNLVFVIVGILGINALQTRQLVILHEIENHYWGFFVGVLLIGLGSGYYHLAPNNGTLLWDRLPMTIAFMAFFSIVVAEFINLKLGKRLLWPLLIIGIFSVAYWHYTEQQGVGDLRLYALVQFLPLLLLPLILLLYPSAFSRYQLIWLFLGLYLLAKVFETGDDWVYRFLGISGHTIKHLLAGGGCYVFYYQLLHRQHKTAEFFKHSEV